MQRVIKYVYTNILGLYYFGSVYHHFVRNPKAQKSPQERRAAFDQWASETWPDSSSAHQLAMAEAMTVMSCPENENKKTEPKRITIEITSCI